MGQFSPGQIAKLNDLYAHAGENSVPGLWLQDGTITYSKAAVGEFATALQGSRGATAYGWGNHALAGYASGTQGTEGATAYSWGNHALAGYASGTQGTEGATAYSWGNHALAGYLTVARALRYFRGTPVLGVLVLPGSPATDSAPQVFQAGLLIDPVGVYTYVPATKTFSGLVGVATVVYYLE